MRSLFAFGLLALCLHVHAAILTYRFQGEVDYIDPSLTDVFFLTDAFETTVRIDTEAVGDETDPGDLAFYNLPRGGLTTSFSGFFVGDGAPFAIKNNNDPAEYLIILQDIDYRQLREPFTVNGVTYTTSNTLLVLTDRDGSFDHAFGPFGVLPALSEFEETYWRLQVSPADPPPIGRDSGEISGRITSIFVLAEPGSALLLLAGLAITFLMMRRSRVQGLGAALQDQPPAVLDRRGVLALESVPRQEFEHVAH